jgi:ligand-binding sensor domain-containing protein
MRLLAPQWIVRRALCLLERHGAWGAALIAAWLSVAAPALSLPIASPTPGTAPGPTPARFLHFTSENFLHFTSENGLSQNTIRSIVQDRSGFLWFATEEGLNRFDGYSFVVFKNKPGQREGLPQDIVTALHEDHLGRLWVGTLGALSLYDPRTETFKLMLIVQREVMSILEDRAGSIWVATAGDGLYRWDESSSAPSEPAHYHFDPNDPGSLSNDSIYSLLQDRSGRIWIGTFGGGLDLFDREKDKFVHHRHDAARSDSLSHDEIWSLAEDSDGRIWTGTNGGGLGILDEATGTFRNYHGQPGDEHQLSADVVTVVYQDRSGIMWAGTEGGGLNRYVREEDRFVAYRHDNDHPDSLGQNAVRAIYEDTQGNLWVSTYGEGLSLMRRNEHSFEYYTRDSRAGAALINAEVVALLEDHEGYVWVGTLEGGFHRFDHSKKAFVPYRLGHSTILAAYEDSHHRIWVGTYGDGLYQFDRSTGTFKRYRVWPDDPTTQRDDQIWAIYQDGEGSIWLATDDGIIVFNPDGGLGARYRHSSSDADSLAHNQVRAFHPDGEGGLWIATLGGGLDHWRHGARGFTHYRHDPNNPHSISHDSVLSVYTDRTGRVWVGTQGGGLNLLDSQKGTFTTFRDTDGLPSNVVWAILEDKGGRFWLSTNKGLCRFDPRTSHFETFDLTNGLQSLQFNPGSALRTHGGNMLFGSWKGLYYFDPESITPSMFAPPMVFTSLRVFGEPRKTGTAVSVADEIRLSYRENIFSIEFAALDYTFPRRNKYAYKLDGFNDRWILLDVRREVTFTNLDPGTYTFRVRGSNSDGVWDERGKSIRVVIPPPFWATWWFRMAGAVGLLGVLFSAHRLRVRSLETREKELVLRVDDAMSRVKVLKGLLPICATCKKVRDDRGYWNQIESYIRDRSEADFSHGICPDCIARYYPEYQGSGAKKSE